MSEGDARGDRPSHRPYHVEQDMRLSMHGGLSAVASVGCHAAVVGVEAREQVSFQTAAFWAGDAVLPQTVRGLSRLVSCSQCC